METRKPNDKANKIRIPTITISPNGIKHGSIRTLDEWKELQDQNRKMVEDIWKKERNVGQWE